MHAQPGLNPELGRVAAERPELLPQCAKFLLGLRVGCHDWHPTVTKSRCARDDGIRGTTKPDRDRTLHRHRHDTDVLETVKSTLERHEVVRPKTTEYLNLFGLTRAARFPFHSKGFVLDVIPSHADAQPETATAQEIHLGRLLSDNARLTLRRDQNSGGEPDGLGGRGQKAKRDKGLVERIFLIVKWDPAISALCTEDVIGDFNVCVPEVFGRLRPIADLRGVCPNIK